MGMMEIDGRERSVEMKDHDDSPIKEKWEDGHYDLEESRHDKSKDSSKHRSKDRKSSGRREEKEHKRDRESRDLEKDRSSTRDRRKEDKDERERDKTREKIREKDSDRDKHKDKERERDKERRDRGKEKERDRERELERDGERGREKERDRDRERDVERDAERVREKERGKDKGRDKDKEKEKEKERIKDKEREKHRDREKEKEREYDWERGRDAVEKEKGRERTKDKGREVDEDKERPREKDRGNRRQRDEGHGRSKDQQKDDVDRLEDDDSDYQDITKQETASYEDDNKAPKDAVETAGAQSSASELEERILKMKEERLKKKSEGASEVLSWVNKSRKLEEKRNAEKEKALQLSKIFEEQDKLIEEESDDEERARQAAKELGGVKVLHGLDKVVEGGAVVLTLKDQSILDGDDINQEVDVLENVEIGEQKRRDDAYKAAKKKSGIYDDKFNDEPGFERKMLPQYDDPAEEEGVTLDASGGFSVDAEKKLEELRKRIQGGSSKVLSEDLNSSGKVLSDYYTQEEMLQFKKPKKKKSLRKKEKMDLDALEAEAKSAGLGVSDLGSRNDKTRQAHKEEKERTEAEMRSKSYQAAYAKAEEASKALRPEKANSNPKEEEDIVFDDDDEELRKSLERARKLALKKQEGLAKTFPESIASLATSRANDSTTDNPSSVSGESQENKVVFTEMEEFVWGLQLDEEEQKPGTDDVFMEEDELPKPSDEEMKNADGGWSEVKEAKEEEPSVKEEEMEITPDETIHEVPVGKGLSGALKLLKDRGTLKEDIEWGGRNMDKKKSKLVGIRSEDGKKEIRIERTDEFGRILTPKEAFRLLSHKFHGKGPGKMKQEKRQRQYQEELKIKQMKNSDTPSLSVERMREAQAQLKTPYLVLSGHVKPGQTSDPQSGFATVEKELPGGLTPMLGDKKVEHFLGIKRKPEPGEGTSQSQKKPKN